MRGVSAVEREAARLLVELQAPGAEDVAAVVAGVPWQPERLPEGVDFDVSFPQLGHIGL